MTEADQPWYEAFFGRDYLEVYGYQLTPERAAKEAEFVQEAVGLRAGDAVLDLCCGEGRHSLLLAQKGLAVTALDLSQEYVAMVAASAADRGLSIETVTSDMRVIPFRDRFDAVINMFTAFGYLETEAEDAKVLTAVAGALKPGGRLLMDMINREWVVANYIQNDWHSAPDGTIYVERRELDLASSRNHVTFTAIAPDGGRREIVGHHVRLYSLTEMIKLLDQAGFAFREVYGGFDGEAYGITTRRMIIVAARP